MPRRLKTALEYFEDKALIGDDCWEWTGTIGRGGYGKMQSSREASAHPMAHRISYRTFVEDIPAGLLVLHRCDNPACVKPAHLFLGTQADNMRDKVQKGRHDSRVGELNYSAKLTTSQVQTIRDRLRQGAHQLSVAESFGVAPSTISRIATGDTWGAVH